MSVVGQKCLFCNTQAKFYEQTTGRVFCNEKCQVQFIGMKRTRSDFVQENEKGIITLNVGGRKFTTLKTTLQKFEASILFLITEPGRIPFVTDAEGLPFLDINPDKFTFILDWLRTGQKQSNVDLTPELQYLTLLDDYNATETQIEEYSIASLQKRADDLYVEKQAKALEYIMNSAFAAIWAEESEFFVPHSRFVIYLRDLQVPAKKLDQMVRYCLDYVEKKNMFTVETLEFSSEFREPTFRFKRM